MSSKRRSLRQDQERLAAALRSRGADWPEVIENFRLRYGVNARMAVRLARGMSQSQVAEEWNRRWPEELKTHKSISYWEQWPSRTGHEPSLRTLECLAAIYECRVADLVIDLGGETTDVGGSAASDGTFVVRQPLTGSEGLNVLAALLRAMDFNDLAQRLVMWALRVNPSVDRRELLFRLSSAFAVAAAAPIFDKAPPDGRHGIARALEDPDQLDEVIISQAENVLRRRREGDVLGAQVTLQSVMAERQVVRMLLGGAPRQSVPHLLSIHAELTQLAGWLLFNLGDDRSAAYYYEKARTAAHDAQNMELVTYILCTMSHLATWQGQPRVGIDHAVAAQTWGKRSGSPRAMAYAFDVTARAHAADGEDRACCEALEAERTVMSRPSDDKASSWWYFHDESFYWGTESECALMLRRPEKAREAASTSLTLVDPSNLHNYALTLLLQAEALIHLREISEACKAAADAAGLTMVNTSTRIDQRFTSLRQQLTPWQRTKDVRQFDEQLFHYRAVSGRRSRS